MKRILLVVIGVIIGLLAGLLTYAAQARVPLSCVFSIGS